MMMDGWIKQPIHPSIHTSMHEGSSMGVQLARQPQLARAGLVTLCCVALRLYIADLVLSVYLSVCPVADVMPVCLSVCLDAHFCDASPWHEVTDTAGLVHLYLHELLAT